MTRVMPMMAPRTASQLRTIYAESFLGIDALRTMQTKYKLEVAEPGTQFNSKLENKLQIQF